MGNTKTEPVLDVLAAAAARACSQATIHPLDTLKVRLQADRRGSLSPAGSARGFRVHAVGVAPHEGGLAPKLQRAFAEVASLYKGVVGAATGAGIILGAYFCVYSTTKRYLQNNTALSDGSVAFLSGATAAVGSSVVKVPIAVCIRSVQAGVYRNALHAARSIVAAAGPRGLFTGFVPTLLEDVPDMAVKFMVYESLRALTAAHRQMTTGADTPSTVEDLLMGGVAGAAAAAATTPLDVVKTRMMCSASIRPTIVQAMHSVLQEGHGWRSFFKGVGPRALSNGINSAVFFCIFEAIRRALVAQQQQRALQASISQQLALERQAAQHQHRQQGPAAVAAASVAEAPQQQPVLTAAAGPPLQRQAQGPKGGGGGGAQRMACLSLALPLASSYRPARRRVRQAGCS